MRYLHSLHYIHYHTQLAIPTVYDDSLSFYEIMNKTNLHFNHVIDDMNKNYEIIDQAFQEVLEKTNEWMEEAKAQADRAEQEANKSQASAEASQQAAEDARNQANRASSEADRARQEADNAENSAADALEQANRAETEANRAQTEAGNAAASATEAQKQAAQSAASATEAKNQADRAQTEATNAANSASEANTQADRAQSEAEKSATSAEESAQSAANAKTQADRAEQEANKSQASAEASQQAAEDARNQANRASSEADRARQEADNAENSAADALEQANRAETEANRAQTEAGNAAASATEAQKQAAQSAASATEAKNQADRAQTEATNAANSASEANTQADRAQSEAEKSATSAEESAQSAANAKTQADAAANSATQAAQSATDAANSAKEAADTLDEAKETFVKRAGDTMSGNLTISTGGLNVTGGLSTDEITDTGKLSVSGLIDGRKGLEITIGSEGGISFQNVSEGVKLSVPIAFTNPSTISNLKTPGSEDQAANKEYVDNINTGVQAQIKDLKDNYLSKNGGTMSGTLDMGNNLITNLKEPAADQNAATKKYVDDSIATVESDISGIESTYLKLSGGTMSGDITMGTDAKVVFGEGHIVGGNNTLLFESFQSLDADGAKIEMVGSPTNLMDAANKNYVDSETALLKSDIETELTTYLPKAGGIMSGSIDMGGKRILNVGTPSINNDAATKGYVDNAVADVSSDFLPLTGGTLTGQLTIDLSGTTDEALTLNGGLIINDNNKNAIGNISPTGVTLYQPLEFPNGGRISAGTNSSLGRILFVGDPINKTDVANKQYVDSKIDTSLFYNVNNLLFHITYISDNLYKCDCYTDLPFNIDIKINNQGTKAQQSFSHPLEDFLIEKGFTFGSGNETFLQTVALSSGVSAIISARLFNNNLVIYATASERLTSSLNVGLTLPISFLCSALISKNV